MRKVRALLIVVVLIAVPLSGFAEDITLIKRAKKVETLQSGDYRVREGDTLWKIFLEYFGARNEDMPYLYKKFRELNPRIKDLNHIMTGQRIVIPRMPEESGDMVVKAASPDVYVMKQGQHLAMILRDVYGVPDRLIFNEYLNLIKEMNPDIDDVNHVEPGQKIKMPKLSEVMDVVRDRQKEDLKPSVSMKKEVKKPAVSEKAPEQPEKEDTIGAALPVTPPPPREKKVEPPAVMEQVKTAKSGPSEKPEEVKSEQGPQPQEGVEQDGFVTAGETEDDTARLDDAARERASRLVRNTLMPALAEMGGKKRDQGTYFMPMAGGSNLSINTSEIPVMELDTGKRLILDVNNKISPEVKNVLEKTFSDCKIVSGPVDDLEGLMDRILSVSGYFSVNRDPGPLLVGEEEKVRFFGKWIVYKDFSRHNVFVVNVLSDADKRTPRAIREYASRFGIDLIELGGTPEKPKPTDQNLVKDMDHSYEKLFDALGVACKKDTVLDLVALESLKITYKAPLLVGHVILTPELPDNTMSDLLRQKGYTVIHAGSTPLKEVLNAVGVSPEGPPIRMAVVRQRTELELPALKVGSNLILERAIDRDIANYLVSQGNHILAW